MWAQFDKLGFSRGESHCVIKAFNALLAKIEEFVKKVKMQMLLCAVAHSVCFRFVSFRFVIFVRYEGLVGGKLARSEEEAS